MIGILEVNAYEIYNAGHVAFRGIFPLVRYAINIWANEASDSLVK